MVITQTVRVGDDARMRCKWCNEAKADDTDLRYEAIERTEDDKDIRSRESETNEVAMHHLKSHSTKEESKVNLLEIDNTDNTNYVNA